MEAKVYSTSAKEIRTVELNEEVFAREVSDGAIYYAVKNELANRRVGTACTKTRAEVNYSNTQYIRTAKRLLLSREVREVKVVKVKDKYYIYEKPENN